MILQSPSNVYPAGDRGGFTQYEQDLRACIRDLVALSTMPGWWVGRSAKAIAESTRDLLLSMLQADSALVEVWDPQGEKPLAAPQGQELDGAQHLARFSIGRDGELGRLFVESSRPEFPSEIESLLLVTANQVAMALRHTVLLARHQAGEQLLAERMAQQAAVAQMGLRAVRSIPIALLLDEVVETVYATLHVDLCEVLELAPDGQSLILRAGAGWGPGEVGRARVTASRESQAGYTLVMARPVIVDDLRQETRFAGPGIASEHGAISGVSVIIHDHHRPFGVLGAHSQKPRPFTADDVNFMQSIANLVAAAVQRHEGDAEREHLLTQLRRAVAARDRAVGIVSHDLGNPLSTVQICATALLDPEPPPSEGIRRLAEIIQRSALWMQQIVHDLLDRASIDSGSLVLERQSVLSVSADEDLFGTADAPGGKSPAVRFTVSDTGPGISAEDLGHIFDWFWQSKPEGRSGTGLGLAIARGVIEAHRGRLRVESAPGSGSTFWFTLPVAL